MAGNPKKSRTISNRDYKLKTRYGITYDQFRYIFKKQDYKCKICREKINNSKLRHIDHNHVNKKVRGILCSKCNTAIGLFRDNVDILKSAIKYLRKSN